VLQHGYDPEGLRSRLDTNGTVRHFVHDGWHVVNELDETERVQASYIRGHEWLTQLDDQGEILNAYTYDAFGNMLSAREQRVNPFRYAGEIQDALTGHYYLRARFYNPLIARFTQEDTYRGDGLNLYAYVANNPIRYVDPSGYAKAGTPASCVNKGNRHASSEETDVPGSYYQDSSGKWHRADGKYASNEEVGIPSPSPKPSDGTHGNSLSSTNPNHVYVIVDGNGNMVKVGISGQPLNSNGTSPRANPQVSTLNNEYGMDTRAVLIEKDLSRIDAKTLEQKITDKHAARNGGNQPSEFHVLPTPNVSSIEEYIRFYNQSP